MNPRTLAARFGEAVDVTNPVQQARGMLHLAYYGKTEDIRAVASMMFIAFLAEVRFIRPELHRKIAWMALDAYLNHGRKPNNDTRIINVSKL